MKWTSPLLLALLVLTACPWKRDPGPAPLLIAEGPVATVVVAGDEEVARTVIAVRAGSAHDAPGEEGLAWLVANGVVEGGTTSRTPEEFAAALDATGAALLVMVEPEVVRYTLLGTPAQVEAAGALLAEALTAPRFDAEALRRLRARATVDIQATAQGTGELWGLEVLNLWLFQGHPYGHLPIGRVGAAPAWTDQAVRRFYQDRYVRPAAAVGVSGDPALAAGLAARLEALPPRLYLDVTPRPRPEVEGRELLLVHNTAPEVSWFAASPVGLTPTHADWPAAQLALAALVARDPAVIRGADLGLEPAVQHTWRVVGPTAAPEAAPAALDALLDALDLFALQGLGTEEFERVRAQVRADQQAWAALPAVALWQGLDAVLFSRPDMGFTAALDRLDLAALNAAIARHFHPENLRIVGLAPDPQALRATLVEETGGPRVQPDASAGAAPAPAPRLLAVHIVAPEELVR